MSALREDGIQTFYQIEHFVEGSDNSWDLSNLDYFGTPLDWRDKNGFGACGDCWQQTGHHGTFDQGYGVLGMMDVVNRNKGHIFRLVKRTISVKTEQIAQACIQKETEAA